jgi:ppGpp synthetase/RelA/SpoT-type nucleotidyltranferase
VRRWLEQETAIYQAVATALIARMDPILAELQQQLPVHERGRLLYRFDDRHVLKTPDRVLEKMARRWDDLRRQPPIDFNNLHELKDLGRFRVVTKFLSDVECICQRLEEPYDATRRGQLSASQQALGHEFSLQGNRFEDLIAMPHHRRKSGERCRKAHFTSRQPEHRVFVVEVQLLTVLQEAWDKSLLFGLWPCPM